MLYLTRHGETELNSAGRLQGRLDSPLTDRGRDQARKVGDKLHAELGAAPVTLCVSPLGRAQETAALLRERLNVTTLQTDERIAEIGLGAWEGMSFEDIEFAYPGALDGTSRYDWAYRAPGGEPKAAFFERLRAWLQDLDGSSVVTIAVSHGWTGMGLRSEYTGLGFEAVSAKGESHEAVFAFADGQVREF